jgi:hypothetical protein
MKPKNLVLTSILAHFILGIFLSSQSLYAQDGLARSAVSLTSPEDKLQALASTRFHFITLKQFHSGLFSSAGEKGELTPLDASLLNAGLNVFLTSTDRETVLLDALRQNKSVRIKLPVSEIEVKPVLDKPFAFQIILIKDGEEHLYRVDWSGKVATESVIGSLA